MIEREYVKLNTSIQTASNSTGLRTDADGNVEATIELKLPESLFLKKDGPKKIDSVRLQTSKMRVSMENTPIASIPLNTELSLASDVAVSTCQLGLYPYCILDNNTIEPYTLYPEGKLSLPYYSAHFVKFNFYYCFYNDTVISSRSDGHNTPEFQISLGNLIYTVDQMNYKTVIFGNSNFESALSKLKLDYSGLERYFNLTNTVNQDKVELSVTGDRLYIYQIGTLQQMLEDALETAFVSTSNPSLIQCDLYFVDRRTLSYVPDPLPNTEIMLVAPDVINDGDVLACFWKAEWHTTEITNMLKAGVKPQVRINSDSLSISYDTAPFNTVPVLWNPSFIENYEVPYSLKLNYGNEGSLYIPPPKRHYQYGVSTTTNPDAYNFYLSNTDCAACNIIANKETVDTFSFLPWTKVSSTVREQMNKNSSEVVYSKYKKITFTETGTAKAYSGDQYLHMPSDGKINTRFKSYYWPYVTNTRQGVTASTYPMFSDFLETHNNCVVYGYSYDKALGDSPFNRFNQFWDFGEGFESFLGENLEQINSTDSITSEYLYGNAPFSCPVITSKNRTDPVEEIITSLPEGAQLGTTVSNVSWTEGTHGGTRAEIWISIENAVGAIATGGDKIYGAASQEDYVVFESKLAPIFNDFFSWKDDSPCKAAFDVDATMRRGSGNNRAYYTRRFQTAVVSDTDSTEANKGIKTIYVVIQTFEPQEGVQNIFARLSLSMPLGYCYYPSYYTGLTYSIDYTTYEPYIDDSEATKSLVPMFGAENEDLYLLDGTTCEVNIGPQEVTTLTPTSAKYRQVTEVTKYFTRTNLYKHIVNGRIDDTTYVPTQATVISYPRFGFTLTFDPVSGEPTGCSSASVAPAQGERRYLVQRVRVQSDSTIDQCRLELGPSGGLTETTYINPNDSIYAISVPQEQVIPFDNDSHQYSRTEIITENPDYPAGTKHIVDEAQGDTVVTKSSFEQIWHTTLWIASKLSDNTYKTEAVSYTPYPYPADRNLSWDAPSTNNVAYAACRPLREPDYKFTETSGSSVYYYCAWEFLYPADADKDTSTILYFDVLRSMTKEIGVYDETRVTEYKETITTVEALPYYSGENPVGNVRLTFTWPDLPMVVLSPISSIVLTLQGMQVSCEYLPYNVQDRSGSSLTSTLPVVENYYSLAQTLRDLHDELVVVKEQFDDTATYTLATTSGQERSIVMSLKYVAKDGSLHQIYIPPNGVFNLQLTFGISYYYS